MIRFLLVLVLLVILPLSAGYYSYNYLKEVFFTPANIHSTEKILFEIESGKTFRDICKELERRGLVKHWWSLDVLARLQQQDKKISSGEYELSASLTPQEIMDALGSGKVFQRMITFKEGSSIWELGALVEAGQLLKKTEFDTALTDRALLAQANIDPSVNSFEGYLFPETYAFSRPVNAKKIILSMAEMALKKWQPEYDTQTERLGFTRHEILTLASIVEKESGSKVSEQPLIASVLHNRLKLGMKLQADPTVIYGIANFNGNLTKADLERPNPYNTYTNFGLPPGPIANPGETAIKAALYPAESKYLYFVADGTGGHKFSESLDEHNDAVRKYQLGG